jgi:hypothetical protein
MLGPATKGLHSCLFEKTLKHELFPSAYERKNILEEINFSAQSYMNMSVN